MSRLVYVNPNVLIVGLISICQFYKYLCSKTYKKVGYLMTNAETATYF